MVTRIPPEELSQARSAAAHKMHSRHDSKVTSGPGRQAFLSRFEREVDPEGRLDPAERARRAEHARSAYFKMLAYKSARARRKSS